MHGFGSLNGNNSRYELILWVTHLNLIADSKLSANFNVFNNLSSVFENKGSVVVSSKVDSKSFSFNTGELNSGVYILIVRSEKAVRTFKVVKSR